MILSRRIAPLGALMLLGGCVGSLLGGGRPDDLYRLESGLVAAPVLAPTPAAERPLLLLPVVIAPEVQGDRILTIRGTQASYVKDARWVSPASDMIEGLARQAFAARAPDILVTSPRQAAGADYALQVSVRRFEAVYRTAENKEAPPAALVEGDARLFRTKDRTVVATRHFAAEAPAAENRVGAIVAAFGTAADRYLADLVDWTSQSAVPIAEAQRRPGR